MSWQRRLRRSIVWALLAKLAALGVLWALFFSPAERMVVTADHVEQRLEIQPMGGSE